ncbi:protein OXIDATIVE STRESS 3 LIKE 4-like [Argentina anserina]|uniref:protein OXIDATIVE STRESS 3 LIKE 4-like n=1 Tax=Argentina anserina TaxID=57926 RepID=UPI002176513F|nr:protein OXIDATIVE STRESS 3 LIKE 4-like [Potentilla anserina]
MDFLVGSTSAATASCLFLNQNGVVGGGGSAIGALGQLNKARSEHEDSFLSSSSSSIGAPDDSDEENESKEGSGDVTDSEEVQSKFNGRPGGLTCMGSMSSLEDSLPIKRGLSNYFTGKSKSFASLSDVVTTASTVKELEKRENPFNKRRRVLIASKWSRKSSPSSFYNHPNPKSMPLLASLNEDEEQEPEETQEDPSSGQSSSDEKEPRMIRTPKLLDRGLMSFKSRSCYCLSDLQGHEH